MEQSVYRTREGVLMIIDDEGNRSRFTGRGYEWLAWGESVPYDAPRDVWGSRKKKTRWY